MRTGRWFFKDESVTSFLGRYTQIKDELGVIGEVVETNSLVRKSLNVHGIVTREVMPTWERMWDDFV
jgi:hypothetical protein